MRADVVDPLHIVVCEGGAGPDALGMQGSRDEVWARAVISSGIIPALLPIEPLSEEIRGRCERAGVELLDAVAVGTDRREALDPPADAYPAAEHWHSCVLARHLQLLESRGGRIAEVEFSDWRGRAFATLQARMLDGLLGRAIIALRLEGGCALRASYRERPRTLADHLLADIERKSLADCDLIRAESAGIAESARLFHGFDPGEWRPRVVTPRSSEDILSLTSPAPLPDGADVACVLDSNSTASIPTLARAFAGFAATMPTWSGRFVVIGRTDADLLRRLPAGIRDRVIWMVRPIASVLAGLGCCLWLDAEQWSGSSLVAARAAAHGAVCVVSGRNPAYRHRNWVDRRTCFLHDGSVDGMVRAMRRAFEVPLDARSPGVGPGHAPAPRPTQAAGIPVDASAAVPVSVVIPHYNLGRYLAESVESARSGVPDGSEIIVVDDASDEPDSRKLIALWQSDPPPAVRVLALPFNVGLGAARNAGIAAARQQFILTLDADDLLAPGFVERASGALQRHPDYDLVVAQAAYFEQSPAQGSMPVQTGQLTFVGEARASGLHANRFATATCLMRRQMAVQSAYREGLDAYEDWDFYQRATADGRRFIVDQRIGLFYRRRPDSMIHSPAMRARHAALVHRLLADRRVRIGQMCLSGQSLEATVELEMDARCVTLDAATLGQELAELERFRASPLRRLEAMLRQLLRRVLTSIR